MPTRKRFLWMDGRGTVAYGKRALEYLRLNPKASPELMAKQARAAGGMFLLFQDKRNSRIRQSSYKKLLREAGFPVYDWKVGSALARPEKKGPGSPVSRQLLILPAPHFITGGLTTTVTLRGQVYGIWRGFDGSAITPDGTEFVFVNGLIQSINDGPSATVAPAPPSRRRPDPLQVPMNDGNVFANLWGAGAATQMVAPPRQSTPRAAVDFGDDVFIEDIPL